MVGFSSLHLSLWPLSDLLDIFFFRPIEGRKRDIRNKHYFPGHFDRLDQLLFGIGN